MTEGKKHSERSLKGPDCIKDPTGQILSAPAETCNIASCGVKAGWAG